MAAASVAVESRSRPSTMKMVLEVMQDEDGKKGVSVQEIKARILARYPEKQEARLRNDLKKAFEKALADGTIVRVKGQTDSGASLTGSFKIANKKPAAKPKAPAKKPSTTSAGSAVAKGKTDAPAAKATGRAQKEEDGKKPAAKKKPAPVKKAKVPVKKTVFWYLYRFDCLLQRHLLQPLQPSRPVRSVPTVRAALSPRATVKGDATFSVEASSPNTLRPAGAASEEGSTGGTVADRKGECAPGQQGRWEEAEPRRLRRRSRPRNPHRGRQRPRLAPLLK